MDIVSDFTAYPMRNQNFSRIIDGVIEEVSHNRDETFATVSYTNCVGCPRASGTVRLAIDQETVILDERGRYLRANRLERGMRVDVLLSASMTRSIPPQAKAFLIRVTGRQRQSETSTGRIIEVNRRDNFILVMRNQNPSSAIRFHLSPNTVILDPIGRQIQISELRPGMRVRVEHASFMTASIPPQSTAFTIQIIR